MLLKVFMKSLGEQLAGGSYIKHYNTISVVLLAVFANSMSQLYIDFEQCVDWLYIIKQLMLLFAVISFQKFYFLLDFYYSGAEKDFYNASKKVRATMSIESIYHSNVLGKIKKIAFWFYLSTIWTLLYFFLIPILKQICKLL